MLDTLIYPLYVFKLKLISNLNAYIDREIDTFQWLLVVIVDFSHFIIIIGKAKHSSISLTREYFLFVISFIFFPFLVHFSILGAFKTFLLLFHKFFREDQNQIVKRIFDTAQS